LAADPQVELHPGDVCGYCVRAFVHACFKLVLARWPPPCCAVYTGGHHDGGLPGADSARIAE
jgi:hypothetical protein